MTLMTLCSAAWTLETPTTLEKPVDDIDHMNDRLDAAMRLEADRRKRKEFLEKAEKLRFLAEAEEIKLEKARAADTSQMSDNGAYIWELNIYSLLGSVEALKEAAEEYERMALSR